MTDGIDDGKHRPYGKSQSTQKFVEHCCSSLAMLEALVDHERSELEISLEKTATSRAKLH
jgi:hypothetical protein